MKRRLDHLWIWDGAAAVRRGSILLDGEHVVAILEAGDAPPPDYVADERIDGRGRLAIPGLICAHTHLYSSLARGMALSGFSPTTFTEILQQLWWRLDKALDEDLVRMSARVGAMEAARCGVTTLIDHHASPRAIDGSLDLMQEEVCSTVGLRGAFCYELSDRDGATSASAGIEENLRFLEKMDRNPAKVGAHFGLHASFTVSEKTLAQVAERIPDDAGIHIHVAEGPEDEIHCESEHGHRIIHRLDRYGLLRPNSILVHCLHVNDEEKDLIAERDAVVVHNPRSNMNNAVGSFDLDGFLARGVLSGLGTDGLGANLFAELFTAALAQKHTQGDCQAGGFPQLNDLLFVGNSRIAERTFAGLRLGRLEHGGPADLAILDYVPPTPLDGGTILGHLLFGIGVHSLRVQDLFVAGVPVLRDGAFAEIDEAAVYERSRSEAARLWSRID